MFLSMHGSTWGHDGEGAGCHVHRPQHAPHVSLSQSLLSDCNRGQWRPKSSSSQLRFRLNVGIHQRQPPPGSSRPTLASHQVPRPPSVVCQPATSTHLSPRAIGPSLLQLDGCCALFPSHTQLPPSRTSNSETTSKPNYPPDRPPCSPPPPARQPPSRLASSPSPDHPPPRRPSSAPSPPPRHNSRSHGP